MNIIFFVTAVLAAFPVFSSEDKVILTEKKLTDYQKTFTLPLDFTTKPYHVLKVSIPKGFTAAQSPDQFMRRSEETMIEYIPNNENINDWSEIITVSKLMGGVSAVQVNERLKKGLLATNENGKILFTSTSKDKSIEHSSFIMQYEYEDKKEIVGISYFSGPCGFAGAQYTIRLKDSKTAPEVVNKIENFLRNNFEIATIVVE